MRNLMIIVLFAMVISSCDLKEDYEVIRSATNSMNGDFYVMLDMQDSTGTWTEDPYGLGFFRIKLYNTSADDADSIWLDDLETWPAKAKIKCNLTNSTFEPGTYNGNLTTAILAREDTIEGGIFAIDDFKETNSIDYQEVSIDRHADTKDSVLVSGYAITVRVINGSIDKGTFVAPSKAVTDAINIEVEFSDDPGTTYRYKGYRRTGFLEDEH